MWWVQPFRRYRFIRLLCIEMDRITLFEELVCFSVFIATHPSFVFPEVAGGEGGLQLF